MKLYIDRATKKLSAVSQGAEEVQALKGGQSEPLRLTFLTDTNGTPAGLADGSTILVTIKETKESETILASTGTFTKTGTEHLGWIDLDNDAVNALDDNDEALVEVKWTESGRTERSDDLVIHISKLLSDGTEDVPIDGSDAVISDFLFARITSTDESVTISQTATGIDLAAEGGGGGASDWGDIGGTLANQTDLQAALDAKSGTGHTHTGLSVQAAGTPSVRALGTGATEAAAGNDSRLSDARTPTAHASTHVTGGSDKIRDASASQDGLMTAAYGTKLDGIEALADVTDAANVGAAMTGATAKDTPIDADTFPLNDSAASNVLKKVTWANIKATLKTYFDTLYSTFSGAYADLSGKPSLGTAAALDVGTTANKVVQLDGSARLPAVDGSQLTGITSSGATLGANTFTSTQTITPSAANTGALAVTGFSNTGTDVTPLADLAGTWNTSGTTPAAIRLNMTHTAATAPRWMLFRRSGTDTLWAGIITFMGNTNAPYLGGGANGTNSMVILNNNGVILGRADAGWAVTAMYNGTCVGSDALLGFNGFASSQNSPSSISTIDAFFMRDAAAVIQMGADHATMPTAQSLKAHDVTTGTGASMTIAGGKGSTAGGAVILATSATNSAPSAVVTVKASGVVNIANLPTSASGLATGDLWNNGGVLNVA